MFNLIISIIAIALVVVLAGASLYYGGDAFNEGSSDAKAATLINQAQQIQASATLFAANEGGAATALEDLTENSKYMKSVPQLPIGKNLTGDDVAAWKLDTGTKKIVLDMKAAAKADDGITVDICDKVNADGSGIVTCTVTNAADGVTPESAKVEIAL